MLPSQSFALDDVLPLERERLVRLCAYFSGSAEVAEDLAQETMVEAWRHQGKLSDPGGHGSWLTAIARNVCLRWRRSSHRQRTREVGASSVAQVQDLEERVVDDCDVEIELERSELVDLLDRALALLSPQTRRILIQRYVDELSEGEMAAQWGITEGAIAGRLHRGRVALRRVLVKDLREEAASYGFVTRAEEQWQTTRIWCWKCGRRRLLARFTQNHTEFWLRCPTCCDEPGTVMAHAERPDLFSGLMSHRRALSRMMASDDGYHRHALASRMAPCLRCGRQTAVRIGPSAHTPRAPGSIYNIHIPCHACGLVSDLPLNTIALLQPEGQRLWRASGRVRTLPERPVEVNNCPATLVTLEAVGSRARVDVLFAEDSFQILAVHGPS
jgi:RNA polymerase sigma factor (sigma-70 family)